MTENPRFALYRRYPVLCRTFRKLGFHRLHEQVATMMRREEDEAGRQKGNAL